MLSKEYDGGTAITNATLSGGEVSGEAGSESLTLKVTGGSYASADVGTGITISNPEFGLEAGANTDKANYRLPSSITLTGTITAKALTIGDSVVLTKVYDGGTGTSGASVKSGGAVNGEAGAESFTLAVSGGTYPQSDVGAGLTITSPTFTLSASGGAKTGNYSYTLPSAATGDITKAEITDVDGVTVVSRRVDGTTTATFVTTAATGTGVVSAELAGFRAGLTVSGTFPDGAKTTAGTYSVAVTYELGDGTGFKKSNYTLGDTGDTLSGTVTSKRVLVLTPTATGRVYGQTDPAQWGYTVAAKTGSEFVSGDSATSTYFTSNPLTRDAGNDVGQYAFKLVSSPQYAAGMAAKYTFEVAAGAKYTITAKALTIGDSVVLTKVYDGGTAASGASVKSGGAVTGEAGSESFALAVSGGTYPQSAVGTGLTISSPTFTLSASGGAKTGNYSYTLPSAATGEITKKATTYTGTAASRGYDGTTTVSTTISGSFSPALVSGDTVTVSGGSYAQADAGTGIAISGSTVGGNDAGNYDVTTSITGTITKKALTIGDSVVLTKVYDGGTAASGASVKSGGAVSGEAGSESFTLAVSGGTYPQSAVGTGLTISSPTFTLSASGGAKTGNYQYTLPSAATGEITAAAITDVSGVTVVTRRVDGTTAATFDTTAATGTGVVAAELAGFRAGLTVSGTFPDAAKTTAGAYSVAVTYSLGDSGTFDASNYTLSDTGDTLSGTVTDKPVLVLTPTTTTREYGATEPSAYEYTVAAKSGSTFATGHDASTTFFTSNPLTRASGNDAGDYAFSLVTSPSYATGMEAAYAFEVKTGAKYTITKKALTIGDAVVLTKVYDGGTAASGASVKSGGAVSGEVDSESFTLAVSGGTYPQSDVGTGLTITSPTFTLSASGGAKTGNYQYTLPSAATGEITKKATTYTGTAGSRVYDGTTTVSTTISGSFNPALVSGDTVTVSGGSYAQADAGTNVAISGSTVSGNEAGNYDVTVSITGTITKQALTIGDSVVLTKVYDGGTAASGASVKSGGAVTGEVDSESFTLAVSGGTYPQSAVGAGLTITSPTFTLSASGGAKTGNYSYTLPSAATGEITKKATTYTGTAGSRVYDGTTTVSTTISGSFSPTLVSGDTVTVSGGSYAQADAGTNVAISGSTVGGSDAGNYDVTVSITGTITAKALTIGDSVVLTKVYDGGTAASGASVKSGGAVSGEVDSESFTLAVSGGTYPQSDVGTGLTITSPTFTLSASGGAKTGNYSYTLPSAATGEITAAAITDIDGVTVVSRRVDGTTAATFDTTAATGTGVVSAELAGFRAGLTVSGTFPDGAKTTAGTYNVAVTYTLGDSGTFDASNYTLSDTGDTLSGTVTDKPVLVLTPTTTTREYGATEPTAYEYTVAAKSGSTFATGHDASTTFFTSNPLTRASGNDAGDYAFSLVTSPAYATGMEAAYAFEVTSGAKYTITKKALTIGDSVVLTKAYDGGTGTSGASVKSGGAVSGEVGSESFTLAVSGGTYPQSAVGTGLTISSPTFTLSASGGAKTGNYSYTLPSAATGEITAAAITDVSGVTVVTRRVDGTTTATFDKTAATGTGVVAAELAGFRGGLTVSGTFPDAAKTTAGAYSVAVTYSLGDSGAFDASNYTLSDTGDTLSGTVTDKPVLVLTPTTTTREYGATEPSAYEYTVAAKSGSTFATGHDASTTFFTSNPLTRASGNDAGDYAFSLVTSPSYATGMEAAYAFEVKTGAKYTITKKALTIGGSVVLTKAYDGGTGTSGASVKSGGAVTGEAGSESFTLAVSGGTYAGTNAKDVGAGKTITSPTFTLSASGGAKTSNYSYTLPTSATGEITAAAITDVSRVTVVTRPVDGTTTATFDTTAATGTGVVAAELAGFRGGLTVSGTFPDGAKTTAGTYNVAVTYSLGDSGAFDASNYTLSDSGDTLSGTISALPVAALVLTPSSIAENGGTSTVTATLSGTVSAALTLTVAAQAVTPAVAGDFTLSAARTLTIAAGATSSTGTVTITAVDNDEDAADKQVTVSATVSGGSGVAAPAARTLTIVDDDAEPAGITLSVTPAQVAEDVASAPTVTVTAAVNGATRYAEAKTVTVAVGAGSDTATEGTDYAAVADLSIGIAAGAASGTASFTLTPTDDAAHEGNETISVTGTTPGVTVTGTTLTIVDDEAEPSPPRQPPPQPPQQPPPPPPPQPPAMTTLGITVTDATRAYGGVDDLSFTVSGLAAGHTAAQVLGGSLARAAGEDVGAYAITLGTLAVTSAFTDIYELPDASTLGSYAITPRTITAISGVTVVSRDADGTTAARFDTGAATGAGVVAAELADFRGGGLQVSGSFAAAGPGTHAVHVTWTLADSGSFKAGNYVLGSGVRTATLRGTLTPSTRTYAVGAATATEGSDARLTITLGEAAPAGGLAFTVSAHYETGAGRAAPADVGVVPSTVTVTAGTNTATLAIAIVDDAVAEADETFSVTIAPGAGSSGWHEAAAGSATASVTIAANDSAGVTLDPTGVSVAAGATVTYTVVLDSEPAAAVTLTATSGAPGTATVSPATRTFTASDWNTAQRFTVTGVAAGTAGISHATASSDAAYGASLPVAAVAVRVRAVPPGAPTGVTLDAGDATLTASWSAPASTGGAAISRYEVQHKLASAAAWPAAATAVGGTTAALAGLTNGSSYEVRVRAVNAAGGGAWSTPARATPTAPPSSDATLSGLSLAAGALTFATDPNGVPLNLAVAKGVAQVTLTATAGDPGATIAVGLRGAAAQQFNGGRGTATIALAVGENVIDLVVTAADGSTRTYTVKVTRAPNRTPVFSAAHYRFELPENRAGNEKPVPVRDADGAPGAVRAEESGRRSGALRHRGRGRSGSGSMRSAVRLPTWVPARTPTARRPAIC